MGMGGARGLVVGVLPAFLGVGVGHEPRVAVDADGLVRGGRRRPRAPAALLGPAPRHLRLLVDEAVEKLHFLINTRPIPAVFAARCGEAGTDESGPTLT